MRGGVSKHGDDLPLICEGSHEALNRLSSGKAFSEKDRESATSFVGWPLANPGFSSRIRFVMAVQRPLRLCHVLENPRASPVPFPGGKGGSPMALVVRLL